VTRLLHPRPATPAAIEAPRDLAPLVDHTILREQASADDAARASDEALVHGFAGVCVREALLPIVVERLGDHGPVPIAVADFPRGLAPTPARVAEVGRLVALGAREVDVVFPLALLAARDHAGALRDLEALVRAAGDVPLKVILETAGLTDPEKGAACALAVAAGAAWVKTSTGFGAGGATEADVALLRRVAGPRVGVKASGGIRTAADALRMVRVGASRIGTSAGVAIVTAAGW
jgi:deoxyribose-phosphate aldolase